MAKSTVLFTFTVIAVTILPIVSLEDSEVPILRDASDQKASADSSEIFDVSSMPHHIYFFDLVKRTNISTTWRAFCGGNIISINRVVSSSHCLYDDWGNLKYELAGLRVTSGVVWTIHTRYKESYHGQWNNIKSVHYQRKKRFPYYNLLVVVIKEKWRWDKFVAPINMSSLNQEFNGVCQSMVVKPTVSFALRMSRRAIDVQMLSYEHCSDLLLRGTKQFHCSKYQRPLPIHTKPVPGAGLICFETNDPAERNKNQGIMVGVTTFEYKEYVTLHTRIGPFFKWVMNAGV